MQIKRTKNVIDDIRTYLVKRFGAVQPEWELNLALLADNIDLYKSCKKAIDESGIYDAERWVKNPLLSTIKDLQATISKQIQHFGLSPYSACKINTLDDSSDAELLKSIMGEDNDEEDDK